MFLLDAFYNNVGKCMLYVRGSILFSLCMFIYVMHTYFISYEIHNYGYGKNLEAPTLVNVPYLS